ncbi:MAG: ABC transporter permease [Planctomycetes bacterium]|jgi:ABC-type transport system involved in multi-copper enzyme maturation permease subunit|nr:ABC transporter permease [Planctomycetota bacterium]
MQAMPTFSPLHYGLRRLLGALSDKELRSASRRRRSYALRSGYIVLLCALMLATWYRFIGLQNAGVAAFGVSRASVVSLQVAGQVIMFQFVAAQLIAALMLSSSMGDELHRGTLGVLLTTPITSLHIVLGKLLSGLLQSVLLLAISLPVLAILRVLGGLAWNEVFATFWITLTAALFAGSVSLLLSTYYRHSFSALSAGAAVYLALFIGLPFAASCLAAAGVLNQAATSAFLDLLNPFRSLHAVAPQPWRPRPPAAGAFFSWPVHCLIMAGAAVAVSGAAVGRIRRAAAGGWLRPAGGFRPVERLHGSPVAWKEDPAGHVWRKGEIAIAVLALATCVLLVATKRFRNSPLMVYHYYGLGSLWLMAYLRLALATAGGIAREKESGAWQVLLTTPLGERQILWGKAKAAWRREAVLLLSLLTVEMCFLLEATDAQDRLMVVVYVLFRLAAVCLLTGTGLYFGVRLRTTTLAVAATLLTFLFVNYFIVGQHSALSAWIFGKLLAGYINWSSPTVQLVSLVWMAAAYLLDLAVGLVLWRRARRNLRAYIF